MPLAAVCGHFCCYWVSVCVCIKGPCSVLFGWLRFLPMGFYFYHPITAALHIVYRGMFTPGLFHCELRDLKVPGPPCPFFLINRFSGGGRLE